MQFYCELLTVLESSAGDSCINNPILLRFLNLVVLALVTYVAGYLLIFTVADVALILCLF